MQTLVKIYPNALVVNDFVTPDEIFEKYLNCFFY